MADSLNPLEQVKADAKRLTLKRMKEDEDNWNRMRARAEQQKAERDARNGVAAKPVEKAEVAEEPKEQPEAEPAVSDEPAPQEEKKGKK